MVKINYTGTGSDGRDFYTEQDFLELMNKECTHKKWTKDLYYIEVDRENDYRLQFGSWYLPDDFMFFSLKDWIEYSGATLVE